MQQYKSVLLATLFIFMFTSSWSNAQETGGPYTPDENTILLMHFDGNLNEEASNYAVVNHGIAKSYIANPIPGLSNAIHFDNSSQANNSYITVPYSSELSMSNNWTIEFWFKINSWDQSHNLWPIPILLPSTGWDTNYYLEIPSTDGKLIYSFSSSDGIATIRSSNNSITTGTWYHVALINDYDNNLIKLILRDADFEKIEEQSASYTAGTTISTGTEDLRIGAGIFVENHFNGYMDELRISNVVRDFSYTLDKPQIISENFIIYYDQENSSDANTILNQLQNKIDFYKKYFFEYDFADHSKIFSINICKDIAEFNQFKPDDLPDFETSYLYEDILFLISPITQVQQAYFNGFEQAAMHAFAKMFVDYVYNYNASEWMKYGFARHQSGMKSTPEQIRAEVSNLGRNPTMQEMNNWDQITSFDKYAFAYTIFQYVADVYSFNNVFGGIRFGNNTTSYSFRYFNTESEFETTWHFSLDLFYLRETNLMELQRETEHFYLYMVDEDLPEIDQWASELEEFYTRFTNDMQMTIEHKIHIFFYPTIEDFQNIEGLYEIAVGHIGEKLSIDMCKFSRKYLDNDAPIMNSIILAQHELTHVIHGNLEIGPNPGWLVEGLATLVPRGLFSEDIINGSTGVIKEQVNVKFSEIVSAAGRYPTIDDFESGDFESRDFFNTYGVVIDPYLLGAVLVDYILKSSGYIELKEFIISDALDYTTLGFTDKVDFMNSFYSFYEENWKIRLQLSIANNVQSAITIDGNINETDWSLDQDIEGIYPFYQHWSNNTAKYGVLWNDDYLYVAFEVLDNNLENNSSNGWNDGVEVFIDADFNKGYQYDSFDRHFTKGWNNSGLVEKNSNTTGVLHAVQNISGGFTVEMAIPWSNLGIIPFNNKKIGFDVSNIIDDNGSKYQLIWSGNNFNNGTTINFGELTLFSLNAPVVSNIPAQTISEGGSFATIDLDDFVTDPDNAASQISWSFSGNNELSVEIDSNRVATITIPNSDWNGSETITFIATDPEGDSGSDDVVFTVTGVNDAPVVSDIPGQTISEGNNFTTIQLDNFVVDIDNADSEITWSYSGNSDLSVTINGSRIATIATPNTNWNGSETITFTATDPSGESDSDQATYTITSVNDGPVVSDIPDQTINEGGSFATIQLDNFVTDVDNSDNTITWNYSGNSDLIVTIDGSRVAAIRTPNAEWNGSETITFTATDPDGASANDRATFSVTSVNDGPVVTDIPNQTINEGSSFITINLDDYVSDPDNTDEEISWTATGNSELTVNINSNRVAAIAVPNENWNGSETITFTATDPNNVSDNNQATFTVTPVNDPPVVSNIPDQTINEGGSFMTINLNNFVTDPDNEDSEISWSFSGNNELSVEIDSNRVATITIPNSDWNGSETITFTATDPENTSGSNDAVFTVKPVNDPPVISGAPELIEFVSDTSFTIDIWELCSDVETSSDSLTYGFSVDSDSILYSFDDSEGILTLSAELEFGGEGNLIWSVSDSEENVEDTIRIVVERAIVIGIDDELAVPEEYTLYQNYPNPFNPSTMIKYAIPANSEVRIEIFNMLGQSVDLLVNSEKSAGYYETAWDASNLPSGTYIYRLNSGTYSESRKMLLLR